MSEGALGQSREGPPRPALSRRERSCLLVVSAALALALALAPSTALYGDGIAIVEGLVRRRFAAPHPGLLPPAALIEVSTGMRPETVLRLLCAVGGALSVAGTYLALRRLGFGVEAGTFGAALVGLAPASLFFSRQIEVHSPHAGAMALAFAGVAGFSLRGTEAWRAASGIGAVVVTHATGALSVPFLLGLGHRLGRGGWSPWFRRVLLPGILGACGFVLGVSLLDFLLSPPPRLFSTPVHAALRLLVWAPGRAEDVEGPIAFVLEALLLPSGLLSILGTAGLLRGLHRRERWALPLTLWVLVYAALGAKWKFVEEGGYLLPVYPALAVGAASLAESPAEGGAPPLRTRGLRTALLVVALCLQGWHGVARGLLPSLGPEPFAWVEAARLGTGERGWFVSVNAVNLSLARRYTGLSVATPAWFFAEPPETREVLLRRFAEPLVARSGGEAVWIDQDGPPGAADRATWERFLDLVRKGASLEPATREPFRAWRVLPRR
ncbi:MAG: hypothetical protein L0323_08585 [Planctomycetes bacterium]|nr:hypothetical protein [Planctomycetota bacterium]